MDMGGVMVGIGTSRLVFGIELYYCGCTEPSDPRDHESVLSEIYFAFEPGNFPLPVSGF